MSHLDENQVVNDNRILGYSVNGKPSAATPVLQFNETTKSFDWVVISSGSMGDLQFLRTKQFENNLIKRIAKSFTTSADQITYVVPNGKTFYLAKVTLIPITNTQVLDILSTTVQSRVCIVDVNFDGVSIDMLGYDFKSQGVVASDPGGMAATYLKPESTILDSLVGDGAKSVTITSSGVIGTFTLTLMGWLEDS